MLDRGAGARRRLRRERPPGARDRDADPDRRELHGAGADGAGARRRRVRFRHAGRAAHRRRQRLDARRRARARRRRGDVEPPVPRGELPSARRHANLPLARVRRLGRAGSAGPAAGERWPCAGSPAARPWHDLGREISQALRRLMFTRHYAHWPPGLADTLEEPRASVYANLEASATRHPAKTAIDFYGTKITYAEVKRSADALAGFLQKRCGVRRGDRVLMYLQNSPQFVIAYYAILRADAVVVPVNPMNRTEELRHYIEDADASAVIAGQELFAELAPLRSLRHVLLASYADYLREATDLPVPAFVRAPRQAHAAAISWREAIEAGLDPAADLARPAGLPPTAHFAPLQGQTHRTHSRRALLFRPP